MFDNSRSNPAAWSDLSTSLLPDGLLVRPDPLQLSSLNRSSNPSAVAFVDAALPDYQTLAAGLSPNTVVYLLDSAGDALSQMSQVLSGYSNLSAVQVFSHGSNGALQLGNTSLTSDNLLGYAGVLQSWAGALSEEADLLFYGCNLAEDTIGQSFVTQLATLTEADVAASTDLTGNSALGGNWNLEFSTGSIEASEPLSDWAQATYQNVLATYTVSNLNDSGAGSLRDAIDAANASVGVADTINFASPLSGSTITLTNGQLLLTDSAETTINGGNAITVSGNTTTRIFNVASGAVATLNGLTITGGSGNTGGGIYNGGTVTVSNSTFSGNSGGSGGGIYNDDDGTLTVSNSTFSGNSANSGGGIFNDGTLTVSNSTLSGNSVGNVGGGIFNSNTVTVSNSTLSGNSATGFGGGIFSRNTVTVSNSTLSGNSAEDGGGILNDGTLTVSNSTLSGNSATGFGGGIFSRNRLTVSNSTLSGNSAAFGGGISNIGTVTVSNSIVAGNTAPDGREIDNRSSVTSGGYNLFGFNGNSGLVNVATVSTDITPTVDLSAILDTTLRNNGGPTQTLALVAGSPAIDAGNTTLTTDQRGIARPQGAADDIGAFELEPPSNRSPVARNDSFTTNEDTVLSGNLITNTNPNGADSDPDGNPITVATVNGTAISGATTVTLTNGSLTINPNGSFTYTPNANANGSDSFTYTLSDGTVGSNPATVSLTITPVNDAPVLTAPANLSVQSGTSTISGISISDIDAGTGILTTTLSVSSGTLNFGNLNGATVSSGALNSSSVTITGTLTQLNAALSTLRYNSGSSTVNATLNISVNDNGNTGGGALTDSETIALRVAEDVGTLSGGISVTRTGSVSSTDPVDRYQFTLATPTNAFFLSLSGLTANADVFILNSSGTVLRSSTNGGLTAETIFGLSLGAGTYFIEVRRVSGNTNYNLLFRR